MITISTKEMIEFYKKFDAVDFKYQPFLFYDTNEEEAEQVANYYDLYRMYQKHEYAYQISELTKKSYSDVMSNLDLVYADSKITDEVITIYDLVTHKLINQYLNIDGIERMFSEKYVDFEWDMHLGIDYRKHSMEYYRDHFIHQVRNGYMMHMLLENGYERYITDVLENESNGKISRFVYKLLMQQVETPDAVIKKTSIPDEEQKEEIVRKYYLRNIIYMSCYMSALFHDIGYPEVANIVNRRRITEYISNIYNLETNYSDFNRISTLLQNSLLFRVVSAEEIKKKIEKSKPDHGVLSAIIFLMHFYENGAIHRLEPYKLCAVELAGLAIYNHTAKYKHGDKKLKEEDAAYYKTSFILNPISYLLRICDDLQEWDRIYFEISNQSNLIICDKCKTPIVRKQRSGDIYYQCNCSSSPFVPAFKYDAFPYRRIYNVTVCDKLSLGVNSDRMVFRLEYNLENLLHVAYLNSNYAKYRIKELNLMKYLFDYQLNIPRTVVKYFVSANPILIKTKILHKWLEEKQTDILQTWWKNFETAILSGKDYELEKEAVLLTSLIPLDQFYSNDIEAVFKDKLIEYIKKALDLYSILCCFMHIYEILNSEVPSVKTNNSKQILNDMAERCKKNILKESFYTEDARCLIGDCFKQFRGMYKEIEKLQCLPKEYYQQFAEDANDKYSLYDCCDSFTSAKNYIPICTKKQLKLDAFTDLYVFQQLIKELSNNKA